jgi:hypothetical protein
MARRGFFPLAVVLALASTAAAAPPLVPERISYQGVLLDDQGQPRSGVVDLELRIYDAASGGTLIYFQDFPGVALADGVFTIELGPAGQSSDTPDDPLTTSLADALLGDLAAVGSSRFLETTVGTEAPLARVQILTVPYALRAESAASADSALLALSAVDTDTVGGVESAYVTEFFQHASIDGQEPDNFDPREGLGDSDGDGIANFIDPDNDDDGLLDGAEIAQGSDINLVTPTISGFAPPTADGFVSSLVQVQGSNFQAGLGVDFGSETPTPFNLTPTSFDVQVGPQAEGPATVTVTLPDGESASAPFSFFFVVPVITVVDPSSAFASSTAHVTVTGSGFDPGMSVQWGNESPTPQNVSPTSFEVDVGPQPAGFVDVTVTHPNGKVLSLEDAFAFYPGFYDIDADPDTALSAGVTATGTIVVGGRNQYAIDLNGDSLPDENRSFPTEGATATVAPGQIAVAFDPSDTLVGMRCRPVAANHCDIEVAVDSDADFELDDETGVLVETLDQGSVQRLLQPSLAFDAAGRVVAGYSTRGGTGQAALLIHDLDGDGDFDGPGERVEIEPVIGNTNTAEVAVDASSRASLVYWDGSFRVKAAYDRNGDGDFDDAQELLIVGTTTGEATCIGSGFAPDGDLALVYGEAGQPPRFLRDRNGDGDFDDAGEAFDLGTEPAEACDVGVGTSLGVVHNGGGVVRLLVDGNDDGDFDDPGETQILDNGPNSASHLELLFGPSGPIVVSETSVY